MKIQLKRSNVLVENNARQPTPGQMEYGELAVNYNTTDPAIFIKDSNNNIIRIAGKYNIADDGQVELPATPTPPSDPKAGNLWYNNVDGRLYIYYTDEDTSQWVDASPDSWDPSSYPDVTDDDAQSGTLDDRYLMLNAANDPVTGGLNVTGGNVGIGTTSPGTLLDLQSGDPRINITDTDAGGAFQIRNTSGAGYIGTLGESPLVFIANSSEFMRLQSNGRLGINTNNPATTVDVDGSIYFSSRIRSTSGGTEANPSIQPGNDADTGIFHPSDSNTIGFSTTGEERVRIDNSGNVLVGTTSVSGLGNTNTPAFGLAGAQGNRLGIYGNGARWWYLHGESSNTLTIGARISGNSADKTCMTINSSGNTGIGVNTTSCKLEVNGDIGIGRQQGGYTFREVVGGDERAGMHSSSINDLQV